MDNANVSELQSIAIDRLVPTPENPRVFREDQAFAELVESIRNVGVLQPLIARPMPADVAKPSGKRTNGLYDLRAGHRRLKAAEKVGLEQVPVMVREMDDRIAMEVTVSENLQRENLHPLEEANAIQKLLDVGWDPAAIADRLGKTPAWVARRAKLCDLSPAWRKAIADSNHGLSVWPSSLLDLIARLSAEMQDAFLERIRDNGRLPWSSVIRSDQKGAVPTAAELNRYLAAEFLHTLGGAPFKLDDETLVPKAGACSTCPKRASCQPLLFDELEPEGKKGRKAGGDRCLDQKCYASKVEAFSKRKLDELKAEHGKALAISDRYLDNGECERLGKQYGAEVLPHWNYTKVKPKEKGAQPAVVVKADSASRLGQVVWVKPTSAGTSASRGRAKKQPGKPTPLKERRHALAKRRYAHVIEVVRAKAEELVKDSILPASLNNATAAVSLAVAFGTNHRHSSIHGNYDDSGKGCDPWKLFKELQSCKAARVQLVQAVLPVFRDRLLFQNGDMAAERYPECKRVAELLELDWKALESAAAEAIPEPRSWANLNADGTPKSANKPMRKTAKKPARKPSKKVGKKAKKKAGKGARAT